MKRKYRGAARGYISDPSVSVVALAEEELANPDEGWLWYHIDITRIRMAQIILRNLDDAVVKGLKERAQRNNRSLEAEVRQILERTSEKVIWDET